MSTASKLFSEHSRGSILIYVLWILVIISVLAFQLTSASRVITLNQSAVSSQLKNQMQVDSAIQFAIFKIKSNQWENQKFQLNLNNQKIDVKIYNESGFISLYELSSKSLNNVFESVNIAQSVIENIEESVKADKQSKFNTFSELLQFEGIDSEVLEQLTPLISIFHEDTVNPQYSPEDVLMLLPGVDQYSVQKLLESTDEVEREQLRSRVIETLSTLDYAYSDDISSYYRVYVSLGDRLNRVFLKYNRRQKNYRVVGRNSILKTTDAVLE